MNFILRTITDGGELVHTEDLLVLDEMTAYAYLSEAQAPGEGEILQLIGDDRVMAEILG